MRKLTQQEADSRVQEMCNTKGYVLSKPFVYIGTNETRIHLKCLHDGHGWDVSYSNFVNHGRGCPECAYKSKGNTQRTPQQEAEVRVQEMCNTKGYVLSKSFVYTNSKTPLFLKCSHGHEWVTAYSNFVHSGTGCSTCANEKQRTPQQEADARVQEMCNTKGYVLSKPFVYIGTNETRIHLKCLHDGHEWGVSYKDFVNSGTGCKKCAGKASPTQREADTQVQEICNTKGYVLSKPFVYRNQNTRLHLKCSHGHEWNTSYVNFVNHGTGCKNCSDKSKGENLSTTQQEADVRVQGKCKEKNCVLTKPFVYVGTGKTPLFLKCSRGHEWVTAYSNFVGKGTGCPKCGNNTIREKLSTPQQEADARVQGKCKEKNCVLTQPFVYVGTNETRIHLKCLHGHEWNASYSNFVHTKNGCPKCGDNATREKLSTPQQDADTQIQDICNTKGYVLTKPFVYVGTSKTRLYLKCLHYGHEWDVSYKNFVGKGTGCPTCAKYGFQIGNPGHCYVHKVLNGFGHCAYKIGIANDYEQRFGQQQRNHYKPERYRTFWCTVGVHVSNMEKHVTSTLKEHMNWLHKTYYKDGWTETFKLTSYDLVLKEMMAYIEKHNLEHPDEPIIELPLTENGFIIPEVNTVPVLDTIHPIAA